MQFSLKALMIVVTGLCIGLAVWPVPPSFVILAFLLPLATLPTILDAALNYFVPRQSRTRYVILLLVLAPILMVLNFGAGRDVAGALALLCVLLWVPQLAQIGRLWQNPP
jgi:uncharacterized membrane protein